MVPHRQSYRENVSQMISWGHWFTLFNILLAMLLGGRYLLVTDWPATLTGRIYSWLSLAGHFSFLVFIGYLLILFPLTFLLPAQRLLRFIATIIATIGLTLLLVDSEMFTRFHLHLNPVVWDLVVSPHKNEFSRNWQSAFIAMPVILFIEMIFASWSWQKLRSLSRRRHYVRPFVLLLFLAFLATHILYIWADANFYRPITMQRAHLPLSYPMTARSFLAKHGLLDEKAFQQRQTEQGNPAAEPLQYPLSPLHYQDQGAGYNVLLITVKQLNDVQSRQQMPALAQFARDNISFSQHFSNDNQSVGGIFSLFYGISPSYLDSVLAAHTPSALITALNHQGYQLGLFASDGFNNPLYRKALFSDFSLPDPRHQTNSVTITQWANWLNHYTSQQNPWFSWLNLDNDTSRSADGADHSPNGQTATLPAAQASHQTHRQLDQQIQRILQTLNDSGRLNNTIVIITAGTGEASVTPTVTGDHHPVNAAVADTVSATEPPAGQQPDNTDWSRDRLQVPLIIHWPGTPSQQISHLTDHQDIMATLMYRLLHVTTAISEFSQGEDLFTAAPKHHWVISANARTLAITTDQLTLLLQQRGHYSLYDQQGKLITDRTPPIELLLQALTEQRRFIAY